ncbi:hypothetical protein HDV00_008922 [Rhizophlyctis rosea]|nr:hypothetical protein HDV00_008922 [Rhizophlyctis rosea]
MESSPAFHTYEPQNQHYQIALPPSNTNVIRPSLVDTPRRNLNIPSSPPAPTPAEKRARMQKELLDRLKKMAEQLDRINPLTHAGDPSAEHLRDCKRDADKGDPVAQALVGMFLTGDLHGVGKNEREAARYLRLAAAQGFAAAQILLAGLLRNGQGVPKDEKEAAKFLKMAADLGDHNAQYNYGAICMKGLGVEKNEPEAARYFKLAADGGLGVEEDKKEAIRYYRLAADGGDVDAQCAFGRYLLTSTKSLDERKVAVEYIKKSADKGLDDGQYLMGLLMDSGIDNLLEKNEREAIRYYRMAAAQGHQEAQWNVGCMLEKGKGCTRDEKEAIRFYELAAKQGHEGATERLRLLRAPKERSLKSRSSFLSLLRK